MRQLRKAGIVNSNNELPSWPCQSMSMSRTHDRKDRIREARQLTVVPPVQEQMAALPADEILVRSSEEPASSAEELLRSADNSRELGRNDLLRPEQSNQSANNDQS